MFDLHSSTNTIHSGKPSAAAQPRKLSQLMSISQNFPPFIPARFLRNGHAQTLAGAYLPYHVPLLHTTRHRIHLSDGDCVVLHDNRPPEWRNGDRVVLMMHGLTGCYTSGYMNRIAAKLYNLGIRSFRMDLRGCGAGELLAKLPYHSGQTGDVIEVLGTIAQHCISSPVTLVGFSLSGNIALKLAADLGGASCNGLDSVITVCPPIDLAACSANLSKGKNRYYDRHFVSNLLKQVKKLRQHRPDAPKIDLSERPRTLYEFDDRYTAPLSGFANADDYYGRASSCNVLDKIELPTLILAAYDDPLIPGKIYESVRFSPAIDLKLIPHGGHLGFVSRRGIDADQRWLDWRVVEWIAQWNRIVRDRFTQGQLSH